MYCAHNPRSNLHFGYGPADEVRRRFLIPLWNVYSFFATYASIDGWTPQRMEHQEIQGEAPNVLDRWILSRLHAVVGEVNDCLDNYDAAPATRCLEAFVDDLSNWYVRRSRRRFWKSEQDEDKNLAYWTLHECLVTLVKLLAPFIPFVTEEMYQNLARSVDPGAPESVHHCAFPTPNASLVDEQLMEDMALAIRIASLGRSARGLGGVKLRQPLASAVVAGPFSAGEDPLGPLAELVLDELNVKELRFTSDERELVSYSLHPDPRVLGPKYGVRLPAIMKAVAALDAEAWATKLRAGEPLIVALEGETIELDADEVAIDASPREGFQASREGDYLVAVDTTLTDELVEEGLARELVRRIQNLRKDADFRIEDKIDTYYEGDPALAGVMRDYAEYIRQETLSVRMTEGNGPQGVHTGHFEIEGKSMTFHLLTVPVDGDSG
jgi:isoleucyl-tRNA synthetase